MAQLTARTSTIFIATEKKTRVYRSVEEVPLLLRRKLLDATRGINSATILIADKQGREELVRALQGRPSEVQCRLVDNIRSRQTEAATPSKVPTSLLSLRAWLELLLPVAAGATLWYILQIRLFS
jgi:prophage DNA circulation protein